MTNLRSYGLNFSPVQLSSVAIQFYGPFREPTSMANVGFAMYREFAEAFDSVGVHNYFGAESFHPDLEERAGLDLNAPVAIFIGLPDQVPELFFGHSFTVGVFVCETDAIGDKWVEACNRLDLVVTPSEWCRQAFRRSGVAVPLMVTPHGLEPDYRPYATKRRSEPFTFYNTFYKDSLSSRKGLNELVRAFQRVFEGRRDVVLRLRTEEGEDLERCRREIDFDGLIRVEPITRCSTPDFAKIYSEVHCTVHPSKGEGFGLIPFQSIACETPVIAPNATGMKDYLSEDNSIPLKTNGRAPGEHSGNAVGSYFGIDEEHLGACLEHAVENWEQEYEKVRRAAPEFRKRYSWPAVLSEFRGVVAEALEEGSPAALAASLRERYC